MNHQPHEHIAISVRAAQAPDLDCLLEFNTAMALETEGRTLEQARLRAGVQAVIENSARGFYLVGEVQDGQKAFVAGQLLITYEWSDWRNANFWWIQSVYVHEDWRHRGIFRALYQHVYDQAQARHDVCGVRLYVEQENVGAQKVYGKMGLTDTLYRIMERDFVLSHQLKDSKHIP